jgi:hypothetical protein
MKDIVEVISNDKTNQMNIRFRRNGTEEIIYLTLGENANELLSMINPVQMIEKRVKESEDKKQNN